MRTTVAAAALAAMRAVPVAAQATPDAGPDAAALRESQLRPPQISYGVTAGALSWTDGHAEQAVGAVLQYQPRPWLLLGVNPSVARATDTTGAPARRGVTDVPAYAGVSHTFAAARWQPTLGLAGVVSLPAGDSASGFGSGRTAVSADAVLGVTPRGGLALRVAASRALSTGAGSALGATPTSLGGEAGVDVGPRVNASVSFGADLGRGGAGYAPARALGGAVAYGLAGPLTLTVAGSRTLAGTGPAWALSAGVGTAFAGLSPVGATSPASRMRGAFPSRPGLTDAGLAHVRQGACQLLPGC